MRRIGVMALMPRPTRWDRPTWSHSGKDFRHSAGRRAATFGSTFAGRLPTWSRSSDPQRNWSRCNPISSLRGNTPTTAALQKQTRTIPILFVNVSDPIGSGFVASLSRPGGNITGFLTFEFSIGGKWLELLKEIAPRVNRVAFMFNPNTAPYAELFVKPFKDAAASLGVAPIVAPVRDTSEIESVVAAHAREPNGGLIVMPDVFLLARRAEVTALAARYRLPAVYPFRAFTEVGGLISYGNDNVNIYRRAASYADRILRGAEPSELPLQFPVKFELVINRKTADALGLDVPASFYWRADEVIE